MSILQVNMLYTNKTYFFPNFSCDEGRIDDDHIKGSMELGGDILWLIEIIEYKTWIFVELSVKLQNRKFYLNQLPLKIKLIF